MTHAFIPTNLPLYIQCLRIPARWQLVPRPTGRGGQLWRVSKGLPVDKELLEVQQGPGSATTFDAREARAQFFRLKPGDTDGLIDFLATVGLFERADGAIRDSHGRLRALLPTPEVEVVTAMKGSDGHFHKVRYHSTVPENHIWQIQGLLKDSIQNLHKETGEDYEFPGRIVRRKDKAEYILTTTTFMDAMMLTLSLDRVLKAKVRKCARPDCREVFTFTTEHKRKYCCWDCGHLVSVRKGRKKDKEKGGKKK